MTTSPKTPAEKQREHRARRAADGFIQIKIWARPEDAEKIKAFAEKIAEKPVDYRYS